MSEPKILLNEENLRQLGEAMAKAMQQIHEGARAVGRQAGEALAAISKRRYEAEEGGEQRDPQA